MAQHQDTAYYGIGRVAHHITLSADSRPDGASCLWTMQLSHPIARQPPRTDSERLGKAVN